MCRQRKRLLFFMIDYCKETFAHIYLTLIGVIVNTNLCIILSRIVIILYFPHPFELAKEHVNIIFENVYNLTWFMSRLRAGRRLSYCVAKCQSAAAFYFHYEILCLGNALVAKCFLQAANTPKIYATEKIKYVLYMRLSAFGKSATSILTTPKTPIWIHRTLLLPTKFERTKQNCCQKVLASADA